MHGHVKFQREAAPEEGRRSRKKNQTRAAIEDAALTLFAEQGYEATTIEQIARRADIATATFFLHFKSKADVVLSHRNPEAPELRQAILERPASESDLTAVGNAILETWVKTVDPERTARTSRAVANSAVLQGMSYKIGRGWLISISEAIAQRRGEDEVSEQSMLVSHVVLGVLANATESWVEQDCREDLAESIKRNFESMGELSAAWAEPPPQKL